MRMLLSLWRGQIGVRQTMTEIIQDVAEAHGVSVGDLRARTAGARFHWARADFCVRAHADGFSNAQIGLFLGRRHHSSVINLRHRFATYQRDAA